MGCLRKCRWANARTPCMSDTINTGIEWLQVVMGTTRHLPGKGAGPMSPTPSLCPCPPTDKESGKMAMPWVHREDQMAMPWVRREDQR